MSLLSSCFIYSIWSGLENVVNKKQIKKEIIMSRAERVQRAQRAQDILLEDRSIEYVIRVDVTPDYVEVVGYNGGDYLRFRVRDDGSVYEK